MSNKATKAKQIQQLENELQDNEIVMAFSAFRWVTPELHKLRKQLREYNSTIYLGKKSLLEVAAKRVFPETSWEYKAIRKLAKGTAAILFVRSEATLLQIINVIRSLTITLPISKGMTVPTKVIIPKGPTNLEPTQTSWFRCYGIASKISRGKIETIYDTVLCEAGTIVEEPQAMLCKLFNVSLSIHYDIDCIVHLKDLYEFPSYIISYSLENAEKTLRTGTMNIRALESILSQQEEDSSLVCEENIGEVRRCPFSQKENLSEWLAGYEENITTERFQLIKENTHCLFAKRATVWGNKRRWDAGVSLEENCKAIYPEIEEFLGCSEFLKLDGFVLEIGEADKYATTEKQFEETFLSMVELWILENGGNLSDECKAGFYNIAGVLCFLTCFAPCYPASSSRFMFTEESTKNSCFILIQPESSFIRHNLFDPQNPRTSLAQNPPKVCKLIRDNFANHGRPYLKV